MKLEDILEKLEINYEVVSHVKVMTIEETKFIKEKIQGIGTKSLFLTDRKGKYYLVLLEENKRADIGYLNKLLKSHLAFASSEELKEVLNLEPGSVTPLGIMYDKNNSVHVFLDTELLDKKILVHPNTNLRTMSLECSDLIRFIEYLHHEYSFYEKEGKHEE